MRFLKWMFFSETQTEHVSVTANSLSRRTVYITDAERRKCRPGWSQRSPSTNSRVVNCASTWRTSLSSARAPRPPTTLLPVPTAGARRRESSSLTTYITWRRLETLSVASCQTLDVLTGTRPLAGIHIYTMSRKNAPTLASCSFDKHGQILIIFGQRHQQTFTNDMHILLSLYLHFYLLYLLLNSCDGNDAKQRVFLGDCWRLWWEPVVWCVGSEKSRF